MINKRYSLSLLFVLILFVSCTKEPTQTEQEKPEDKPSVSIIQDKQSVESGGAKVNVAITSELSWILEGEFDWCQSDVRSGTGNGTIVFSVARNTTYSDRTASFRVVPTDGKAKEISIYQEQNNALSVEENKVFFDDSEQSYSVGVSSNVDFEVAVSSSDWITVTESKTKALSSSSLMIKVTKNSGSLREATITLSSKDGGLTSTIKVYQVSAGAVIKYKTSDGKSTNARNTPVQGSNLPDATMHSTAKLLGTTYIDGQGRLFYDKPIDATYYGLFMSNEKVTEVELPEGVLAISPMSFYCCKSLVRIVIPESVTTIDGMAFEECRSLSEITLPKNLNAIKDRAFMSTALKEITIPDSVKEYGSSIFEYCYQLRKAIVPDNIQEIPSGLFAGCSSLESFSIPESVTSIGAGAFYGCAFTTIIIPRNVVEIGAYAYKNCTKVSSIYFYPLNLPEARRSISDYSFEKVGAEADGNKTLYIPKESEHIYLDEEKYSYIWLIVYDGFSVSSTL